MSHRASIQSRTLYVLMIYAALLNGCESLRTSSTPPATTAGPEIAPPPVPEPSKTKTAGIPIKKVLVLRWVNRSEYEAPAVLNLLDRRLSDRISQIEDVNAVYDKDVDGSGAFYSLNGNDYNLPVLLKQTKLQGISGFLTAYLEAVRTEEDAEGAGLFNLKRMRTIATVRIDLYDSQLQRRVFTRTHSEMLDEERAEVLTERSRETEREMVGNTALKALDPILNDLRRSPERIAWSGRIARIEWNRYYITGGLATGLQPGQLLRVYGDSSPIDDPLTGKSLGTPPGRFKGLLKVQELFGSDAAVAILHSGAGFRPEDRVDVEPITDSEKAHP